jgi:hypothetical protein
MEKGSWENRKGKEILEAGIDLNNLSEKNEENSHLKNLNQGLLEKIRKLKEEKLENPDIKDIDKSDNEEKLRLKYHNQNLLTQIKSLRLIRSLWKTSLNCL